MNVIMPLYKRSFCPIPLLCVISMVVTIFLLVTSAVAQTQLRTDTHAKALADYEAALQLVRAGHRAEAQHSLVLALALDPGNITIEIALAKLDTMLGRKDDAVNLFRKVLAARPDSSEDAVNLAIALAEQGLFDEALIYSTVALRKDPHSSEAHHIQGKLLVETGHAPEAESEYKTSLSLYPQDPLVLYDFAVLCESTANLSEEISLLRRLVSIRPDTGNFHFLMGRALLRNGDQNTAIAEFREAVRLEPNNRAALYNLARSLQRENPNEAAQYTTRFRALKLSEDQMNLLRDQGNKGVQAMQDRNWPLAISTFQTALATCSGCVLEAILQKDLGLAQCQSGDTTAGLLSLRESLQLNPDDLEVLKAIDLAESVSGRPKP